MKVTLRNFALGTALLTAGAMFAQGLTVTENFSKKITTEEIPSLADNVRVAAGANGYVYALNKGTGEVLAINGNGITTLEKKFNVKLINPADVKATLNTAITTDDAGNIIVMYANGGFWANAPYSFAIMPADGSDVVYTAPITAPEGYEFKRLDVIGRAVGNVLEKGALYLAPGNEATAVVSAGYLFENGVPTPMEYSSTTLSCGGQNLNIAVPAYNSIDELLDAEADYDAMYVQQWNAGSAFYTVNDGKAVKGDLPVPEGGAVGGAPGFDVINRDGTIYYLSIFRTTELNPGDGNRCANFQLTDAKRKVLYASKNVAAEGATTPLNGGSLLTHQVDENKYEVYFWGGPKESVYASMVTIEFTNEPPYEAPELYLRGDFNGWGVGPKAEVEGPDADGLYTYTVNVEELPAGEFKLGTEDWKTSFGAGENKDVVNGETVVSWQNGQNFNLPEAGVNVNITLVVNPDYSKPSAMTVTWDVPMATRAGFAYDLKATKKTGNDYEVTFKATEEGTASLVLTNAEGEQQTVALGAAVKGENTFNVAFEDEQRGEYDWAVALESDNGATEPAYAVKQIWDAATAGQNFARGGVVTLTDANYDTFGYTAVAASRGIGIDIYDPEGNFVKNVYGSSVLNSPNSSPLRGGQRLGKAVFASWADNNAGYYYVDPIETAETPENILVGTPNADGLYTYEGVQTAGGSPCVAFLGEGEDQTMWLYEEDLFKNTVATYPIGTATQLTVAGTPLSWTNSACASQNLAFTPTKYGMFICQNRANGMDEGVPAIIFVSKDGKKLMTAPDMMPEGYSLPNSNGGLAVSLDGSLLAVAGYTAIEFFSMEWEEKEFTDYDNEGNVISTEKYTVPCNLEHLYSIECNLGYNLNNGQAMFDAANNLHYYAAATGNYATGVRYAVITLPGANVATTPAKAGDKIEVITSGVESIEAAMNGEATYFNLNGVRIAPENMTPGVYVKVQDNKAQKVIVK